MGIMVHGAIGVGYKSPLIICENSINDLEYRKNISESSMFDVLNGILKIEIIFLFKMGPCSYKLFN